MRLPIFLLTLTFSLLVACSSTPERASDAPAEEKHSASETDRCLDNPELAKGFGECNIKYTVFSSKDVLGSCHKLKGKGNGPYLVLLKLRKDGSVKSTRAGNAAAKSKLGACLQKEMKKLKFAAHPLGQEVDISIPYEL
ncbi:MAG TPA: hypothetical protein VIH99_05100 [Bdellovibrionota bacterium]|jgi:hypothetical protein